MKMNATPVARFGFRNVGQSTVGSNLAFDVGDKLGVSRSVARTLRNTLGERLNIPSMPNVSERALPFAFCCFPHASPVFVRHPGKQKTAPKDRFKRLISLKNLERARRIERPTLTLARLKQPIFLQIPLASHTFLNVKKLLDFLSFSCVPETAGYSPHSLGWYPVVPRQCAPGSGARQGWRSMPAPQKLTKRVVDGPASPIPAGGT